MAQAGDNHLRVGMRDSQLAGHRGRGCRELGRPTPVVGGVRHPNHRCCFTFRCDVRKGDTRVIALGDPGAVIADQFQRLGPFQVEQPHTGRRRAVQMQAQPARLGAHVVDHVGRDANRFALGARGCRGDNQFRTVPPESALLERALDSDYEAAGAAVVVRRATVSRTPAGDHDLNCVVDTQDRAGVGLAVVGKCCDG
jgi:hypothetical protein